MSSVGSFWLMASCLMGVALASASNKSRDFMSAAAFDVMSTGSKFLTILVSGLIFESLYTPQSLGGSSWPSRAGRCTARWARGS